MTKEKKRRTFTDAFKIQVVSDYYSSGGTLTATSLKWCVTRGSLFEWIKQWPVDSKVLSLPEKLVESYMQEHHDKDLTKEEILGNRIKDLERALELEKLRSRAFEKMIEIAEAEEGISILKKVVPNSDGAA